MKPLKITLAIIVVAAISACIFFCIQSIKEPPKPKAPENQFTRKIEQEIKQLKAKPDSKFCKDFYKEVAYHINDFYRQNRFGNNKSENDQWKENLERNLYSAYTEKFINQAKTVFLGSEWYFEDLNFIQAEKNELKRSKLLVAGSPVDKDFTDIQTALNKYIEIISFVSSCQDYSYSKTDLSARFPIDDVQSKISRAARLRQNHLENEYVNNCTRLHHRLIEIPQTLFEKHVRYLDNKINNWSGLYSNFNSQSDYSNNLYKPINAEINALNNNIYNVSSFDSEYNRLLQKWSDDNTKAYKHDYK
jgi:hypothetical protein